MRDPPLFGAFGGGIDNHLDSIRREREILEMIIGRERAYHPMYAGRHELGNPFDRPGRNGAGALAEEDQNLFANAI